MAFLRDQSLSFSFLQPVAIPLDVDRSTMLKDPIEDSRRDHMIPDIPINYFIFEIKYQGPSRFCVGKPSQKTDSWLILA